MKNLCQTRRRDASVFRVGTAAIQTRTSTRCESAVGRACVRIGPGFTIRVTPLSRFGLRRVETVPRPVVPTLRKKVVLAHNGQYMLVMYSADDTVAELSEHKFRLGSVVYDSSGHGPAAYHLLGFIGDAVVDLNYASVGVQYVARYRCFDYVQLRV
jgi:hypothetical protein